MNRAPRLRIREEDIPVHLREGGARYGLYYSWTIQSFNSVFWIDFLESRLPAPLPPSYRSLVSRYIFPAFEVTPLLLLANTGQDIYHEMTQTMINDRVMSKALLRKGYAQFARPNTGDYDPVCFDLGKRNRQGECPIVRIHHEDILIRSRARIVEEVAPSFQDFVKNYLESGSGLARR